MFFVEPQANSPPLGEIIAVGTELVPGIWAERHPNEGDIEEVLDALSAVHPGVAHVVFKAFRESGERVGKELSASAGQLAVATELVSIVERYGLAT